MSVNTVDNSVSVGERTGGGAEGFRVWSVGHHVGRVQVGGSSGDYAMRLCNVEGGYRHRYLTSAAGHEGTSMVRQYPLRSHGVIRHGWAVAVIGCRSNWLSQ
jgi:hypothetical protein